MRAHFLSCVESGKMTPFPSDVVLPKRVVKVQKVQLYCSYLPPPRRWGGTYGLLRDVPPVVPSELYVNS